MLPDGLAYSILGIFVLSFIPSFAPLTCSALARFYSWLTQSFQSLPSAFRLSVAGILLFGFFAGLRATTHFYGDGYLVLASADQPVLADLAGDEVLKPLTVYIYRLVISLFGTHQGSNHALLLSMISAFGGVVAFGGLRQIAARSIGSDFRVVFWVCVSATSSTMLFLGHVEHYVLAVAVLVWIMYWAMKYAVQGTGISILLMLVAIASFLHVIMAPLWLVPLILYISKNSKGDSALAKLFDYHSLRRLSYVLIPLSLFGAIVGRQFLGIQSLLPVLPSGEHSYWVLSLDHLIDQANALLLAAPLGLAAIASSFTRSTHQRKCSDDERTVLLCLLPLFWASFWLDPVLGASRDWDLLTMYALPLAVIGAVRLSQTSLPSQTAWSCTGQLTGFIFAIAYIATAVFVVQRPDKSLVMLDNQMWTDPHYQVDYQQAKRSGIWGALLVDHSSKPELGLRHLQRAVKANPSDHQVLYNIGVVFYRKPLYDSATSYFRRAVALSPDDQKYRTWLSNSLDLSGRPAEALQVLTVTSNTGAERAEFHRTKGILFAKQKRFQDALSEFRFAHRLAPMNIEENVNLAMVHDESDRIDSAEYYYRRSLSMSSGEMRCFVRSNLLGMLIKQRDFRRAAPELQIYRKECPTASDIRQFETAIQNSPQR